MNPHSKVLQIQASGVDPPGRGRASADWGLDTGGEGLTSGRGADTADGRRPPLRWYLIREMHGVTSLAPPDAVTRRQVNATTAAMDLFADYPGLTD